MLATLLNAPLWVFVICLFGAIFTWLAADQFRDQLVSDSHRLVREVALRYLQITIGLFTIFVIGMFWAVGRFATQSVEGLFGTTPEPDLVETPGITPTFDPFAAPLPTSTPTLEPDALVTEAVDTGPTPTEVPSATIANTQGLGVNMRETAGYSGNIVMVVAEGAVVTLLGETEEADGILWYHVQTDTGIQGWIADLYLDIDEEES